MTLPRYPAYKDSGVEWLGEVPAHWVESRLKASLASIRNGDWGNEPQNKPVICVRVADFDRQKFSVDLGSDPTMREYDRDKVSGRTLSVGDLLIEKSGGGENQLVGAVVYCGPECDGAMHSNFTARMQPAPAFVSRFLVYVFAATYHARLNLRSIKQSTGIQNLDANQYLAERWYWPDPEEQAAIATFLDHETSKIDALIAEQQDLIALLKEKRQAVISHAVTKGLDPDVPMKDSGVEWLGEVPEHWGINSLKRLTTRISSGKTPLGGSETYVTEGVLFLRSQNVYDEGLRLDDVVFISPEIDESMASSRVQPGDVLLNITGASIGRTCAVPADFPLANVNQHVCAIRLSEPEIVLFVAWFMKATCVKGQIDLAQTGAAREGLNFGQIGQIQLALPSKQEARDIAMFLDHETSRIDALIREAEHATDLLRERRSALISAAVTGKIDVRGLVRQEAA